MAALDARHSLKAENQAALLEIEKVRAENLETKREVVISKLEMEEIVVGKDIKRDNVTRDFYRGEAQERDLSSGEKRRVANLVDSLDHKYEDQRAIREQIHEIKNK